MKMNIMAEALREKGVMSTEDMAQRLKVVVKERNSAIAQALSRRNPDGSFKPVKTWRQRAAELAKEERELRQKLQGRR